MASILILNGPNLNMLGKREPELYGTQSLADIETACAKTGHELGFHVECFQSNHEGEIVSKLHEAHGKHAGIIINAGAYSHTSIAILDALSILRTPIIEVHLSNIFAREPFRHHSYVSSVAKGVICGLGAEGYQLALQAMKKLLA